MIYRRKLSEHIVDVPDIYIRSENAQQLMYNRRSVVGRILDK